MYAREGRSTRVPAQGVGVWVKLAGGIVICALYYLCRCACRSVLRSRRLVRMVKSCFGQTSLVAGRQRKKFTTESFVRQALIHVRRHLERTPYPKASRLSACQAQGFIFRIRGLACQGCQISFLFVCVSIRRPCVLVSDET